VKKLVESKEERQVLTIIRRQAMLNVSEDIKKPTRIVPKLSIDEFKNY
jgi:hypothetical protein